MSFTSSQCRLEEEQTLRYSDDLFPDCQMVTDLLGYALITILHAFGFTFTSKLEFHEHASPGTHAKSIPLLR